MPLPIRRMTGVLFRALMAYMGEPVIKELSQIIMVLEVIKLFLLVIAIFIKIILKAINLVCL